MLRCVDVVTGTKQHQSDRNKYTLASVIDSGKCKPFYPNLMYREEKTFAGIPENNSELCVFAIEENPQLLDTLYG